MGSMNINKKLARKLRKMRDEYPHDPRDRDTLTWAADALDDKQPTEHYLRTHWPRYASKGSRKDSGD